MVEYDAFASGIEYGGLRNMLEIKILICYMLSMVKEPMTRKQLAACLQETGLVNYFDLNAAIDELLATGGSIYEADYLGEQALYVTETGKYNARTLETTLTRTIRDRAVAAAMKLLSRARAERETVADIVRTDSGYNVTFGIDGLDEQLLRVSVYAPDILQAEKLKEGFLDDPSRLYECIVDCLLSEI